MNIMVISHTISTVAILLAILSLYFSYVTQKENLLNMRLSERTIHVNDYKFEIRGAKVNKIPTNSLVAIEAGSFIPPWEDGEEIIAENGLKMIYKTTAVSDPARGRLFDIKISSTNWVEIEEGLKSLLYTHKEKRREHKR